MSKEADALAGLLTAAKGPDEETVSKIKKALAELATAHRQVNAAKQVSQFGHPFAFIPVLYLAAYPVESSHCPFPAQS